MGSRSPPSVMGRQTCWHTMGARAGVSSLFTDYDEFLDKSEVDAVLIAVPDEFHLPLARQALKAGKHVLLEKPLGVNSEACAELSEAVRRSGKKLQVGCMKRYDPGVSFAQAFIRERIGEIFSASGWYRDSLFRYDMQEAILPRTVTSSRGHPAGARSEDIGSPPLFLGDSRRAPVRHAALPRGRCFHD